MMSSNLFPSTNKITSNLYLGCAKIARSRFFLDTNYIHGIINATTNEQNTYPESYDYLRVSINDDPDEQIYPFFQRVYEFIRRHHTLGHSVLVHCQMGVSRSATLVIAFLMIEGHKTLGEVFEQVKSVRQQIDPNEGFIKQLRQLETSLFGRTMTLKRITCLDLSIEEPAELVIDRLLRILGEFIRAFADDASLQTLDTLEEKLLRLAGKLKRDYATDLLFDSICKYLRMFGEDTSFHQQARIGLQQGLAALCSFYDIDMNDCLNSLIITREWCDLSFDVPLAYQWLHDVRDQTK